MKLKIFSILICFLLISTLTPQIIKGENENIKELILKSNVEYELDQKQLLHDRYTSIHSNVWVAQSFKPALSPLTKILIKINKNIVINSPLEISIRKDLTGTEIIYTQLQSNQIPWTRQHHSHYRQQRRHLGTPPTRHHQSQRHMQPFCLHKEPSILSDTIKINTLQPIG